MAWEELEDDLAVAIAKGRGGEAAGKMARLVLERDRPRNDLVGVTADAEAAIYYGATKMNLRRVPFDVDGFDGMNGSTVESFEQVHPNLDEWVREHADVFGWVHPRFRWVLQ